MTRSEWIALGSAIATFLSVVVAFFALYFQGRRLTRQLTLQNFSDYTKRYQKIILNFPEDINESTFKLAGRSDYKQTMRYMRAYFDLCYEEWYLYRRQFVDQKIWIVWESGIEIALSKPAFRQAWQIIKADSKFGNAFEAFIARFTEERQKN